MISYIIATCERKRNVNENVLKYQMNELFELLSNKKDSNKSNIFKEVIIIRPVIVNQEKFTSYYDFDNWRTELDKYNIDLVIYNLEIKNSRYSYDQWLIGMTIASGDYYLFIEDDYCLDKTYLDIDTDLIEYYKHVFPSNIGYLCSYVNKDDIVHGYHAATSNGLISKYTIKTYMNGINLMKYFCQFEIHPQVAFSRLFLSFGVRIEDIRDKYNVYTWNSYEKVMEDYSLDKKEYHVFLPIEYHYLDLCEIIKMTL